MSHYSTSSLTFLNSLSVRAFLQHWKSSKNLLDTKIMPMGLIQTKAFGTQECFWNSELELKWFWVTWSQCLQLFSLYHHGWLLYINGSTHTQKMSMNVLTVESMNSKGTLALFHTVWNNAVLEFYAELFSNKQPIIN